MKYLDVLIEDSGKAELKTMLDAHSVTWHETKVLRFSTSMPDLLSFMIQGGVVGAIASVIVKWLSVKQTRKAQITWNDQGKMTSIDVSGYSVNEVEKLLNSHDAREIRFEELPPAQLENNCTDNI
ncbi:hypothetical protein ACE02U_15645 [Shewanella xiamenensis]|uniref:hypothetical protein n=1 Tax=Shewanella xiamenensis TaxID=332186 RepID=UPI0035B6CB8F